MRTGTAWYFRIIAAMLAMVLSACSGGEKTKTQVVARVNGEEITVKQLNEVLSMMEPEAGTTADEARKRALDNLIDKTLGVQAAVNMKLDREPATVQAIEFARKGALLDAYLERVLQKTVAPTPSEIHHYFSLHPELFANRRIYVFNQLTAMAGKESVSSISSKAAGMNSLREFVAWLKKNGVEYSLVSDVKPSEQMTTGMLARMQKLKAGDIGYVSASDGVVVLEVLQIIEKPLTEQQAQPLIEHYLAHESQMRAIDKVFREMRATARVEYLVTFNSDANTEHAEPPPAATQHAPAAPEKPRAPKTSGRYIEAGLHGLPGAQ